MVKTTIFILTILLIGCSSPAQLISQGQLYPGMSKNQFRDVMLWNLSPGDDAFLSGCFREYHEELGQEIISSSSFSVFYVFEQVTVPASSSDCNALGNGIFIDSFSSYNAAKSSIETQIMDRFDMPKMAP